MDPYAGYEPQVGEIRALRTFRIGPRGVLYPLFSDIPWDEGTNQARCRVVRPPDAWSPPHRAPDSECTCGFYAYGSAAATREYPHARHVLAVVACWGAVIAGTRGVRAEFCRVEAIWMSDTVPTELAGAVERHYPSISRYRDPAAMLAEHPLTELDCYEPPSVGTAPPRRWLQVAIGCAVVGSALPLRWWDGIGNARLVWIATCAVFVVAALVTGRGRRTDFAVRRRRLIFQALALWMAAPFAGPVGTLLLRVPLLELGALLLLHRHRLRQAASQFPAVIEPT